MGVTMISEKTIRELLVVTCSYGKKITDLMPVLPKKLKPRHINVVEIIHRLEKELDIVRVSDVSNDLQVTTPSVTKLINELEEKSVIKKESNQTDKRITTVSLTSLGEKYYNIYVDQYHKKLVRLLDQLEEKDCQVIMNTMEYMYKTLVNNPIDLDKSDLLSEVTNKK